MGKTLNYLLNEFKVNPIKTTASAIAIISSIAALIFFITNNLVFNETSFSIPSNNSSITDQIGRQEADLRPTAVSLLSNKSSPQIAGTKVSWTASALDSENDFLQYRFFLDGQPKTDWSISSTWEWITSDKDIGSHVIEVKVKDGKHNPSGDDSKSNSFALAAPSNELPMVKKLNADKLAPQVEGTIITWIAEATDIDDDEIFYRFLLNDKPTTGWESHNIWTWTTTKADIGNNRIEVQIRDSKHSSQETFDDHLYANFIIIDSNQVDFSKSSINAEYPRTNEYADNGVQPNCEPESKQVTCSSPDSCVDCNGDCWLPESYDNGKKLCSEGKWTLTGYSRTNEYAKNGVEPNCEPESEQAICSSSDSCVDCNGKCYSPGSYDSRNTICSQGKWLLPWADHAYR